MSEKIENVPTRGDRLVNASGSTCAGIIIGFWGCMYLFDRRQPDPFIRKIALMIVVPALSVVAVIPRAGLEIFRGLRKHNQLEQEMGKPRQ